MGADLANLVNEAALRAVRHGRQAVNQEDLMVSFETVIAGTEKKNTVLTDVEKRMVAYHEVGHALVAALEKHSQPVSKITIVPHTSGALGYTMQMPEEEKYLSTGMSSWLSCGPWWAAGRQRKWPSASRPPEQPTTFSGRRTWPAGWWPSLA